MIERQAWERGKAHAEKLIAEAAVARQVRAAQDGADRVGAGRRLAASLTRTLATKLAEGADAIEGRRRTFST